MFCPKCGHEMQWTNGELTCIQGDMGLSLVVQEVLTKRFATDSIPQSAVPPYNPKWHSGLRWYCPGCGKPLNAHLECQFCTRHLRDLVMQLVELHPHK